MKKLFIATLALMMGQNSFCRLIDVDASIDKNGYVSFIDKKETLKKMGLSGRHVPPLREMVSRECRAVMPAGDLTTINLQTLRTVNGLPILDCVRRTISILANYFTSRLRDCPVVINEKGKVSLECAVPGLSNADQTLFKKFVEYHCSPATSLSIFGGQKEPLLMPSNMFAQAHRMTVSQCLLACYESPLKPYTRPRPMLTQEALEAMEQELKTGSPIGQVDSRWGQSSVTKDAQGKVLLTGQIMENVSNDSKRLINVLLQKNCGNDSLPQEWSLEGCAIRVFYFVTHGMDIDLRVTQWDGFSDNLIVATIDNNGNLFLSDESAVLAGVDNPAIRESIKAGVAQLCKPVNVPLEYDQKDLLDLQTSKGVSVDECARIVAYNMKTAFVKKSQNVMTNKNKMGGAL